MFLAALQWKVSRIFIICHLEHFSCASSTNSKLKAGLRIGPTVSILYGFVRNCGNHMCSLSYSLMMKRDTKTTADAGVQKEGPWGLPTGD